MGAIEDAIAATAAEIRRVDEEIAEARLGVETLLLQRGKLIHELVGTERGGVVRAARELGVSRTQIYRLRATDIVRRAHRALQRGGWEPDAYRIRRTEGGTVYLDVVQNEGKLSANAASALLNALHDEGMVGCADGLIRDVLRLGPLSALERGEGIEIEIDATRPLPT